MVKAWRWPPLLGARLYFGGLGLMIALVTLGCASESPTGVEMVKAIRQTPGTTRTFVNWGTKGIRSIATISAVKLEIAPRHPDWTIGRQFTLIHHVDYHNR
jgi:hypothetical protein